jgi:hypothetical protein
VDSPSSCVPSSLSLVFLFILWVLIFLWFLSIILSRSLVLVVFIRTLTLISPSPKPDCQFASRALFLTIIFTMLLTCVLAAIGCARIVAAGSITLSKSPPANAPAPLPEGFVSYSIEFSSFPDFAGISRSPIRLTIFNRSV